MFIFLIIKAFSNLGDKELFEAYLLLDLIFSSMEMRSTISLALVLSNCVRKGRRLPHVLKRYSDKNHYPLKKVEKNVCPKIKVHIQNSLGFGQRFRTENFEAYFPLKEKIKRLEAYTSSQSERKEVVHLSKEKWKMNYVAERWILYPTME